MTYEQQVAIAVCQLELRRPIVRNWFRQQDSIHQTWFQTILQDAVVEGIRQWERERYERDRAIFFAR